MSRSDIVTVVMATCVLCLFAWLWVRRESITDRRSSASCAANLKQLWSAVANRSQDFNQQDITALENDPTSTSADLPARFVSILCKEEGLHPKALVCPGDKRRPAFSGNLLSNENVSYFLSTNLALGEPMWIIAGDRNLSARPGLVLRPGTLRDLHWHTPMLHNNGGYLLGADCAVRFIESAELKAEFWSWRNRNNHLLVP